MTRISELRTDRLLLRQWREEDKDDFARMNADPWVMAFYPAPLTRSQSDTMADRLRGLIDANGWGFWALEFVESGAFVGFTGLHEPTYRLPVSPCMEVGWRLARKFWGRGLATEAARAALAFAFSQLDRQEIYAFTSVNNRRSRAVMERLGMRDLNRNFEHPMIPAGSDLSEHVLYRLRRDDPPTVKYSSS